MLQISTQLWLVSRVCVFWVFAERHGQGKYWSVLLSPDPKLRHMGLFDDGANLIILGFSSYREDFKVNHSKQAKTTKTGLYSECIPLVILDPIALL